MPRPVEPLIINKPEKKVKEPSKKGGALYGVRVGLKRVDRSGRIWTVEKIEGNDVFLKKDGEEGNSLDYMEMNTFLRLTKAIAEI